MAENENRSSGGVKRKKTLVAEAEKSAKKSGQIWSRKDEITFVNFLVAYCEKGNCLPKIMTPLYDEVRTKLEGDYSTDQMYNKLRWLRDKFCKFRNKDKDEGFSSSFRNKDKDEGLGFSFNDDHEETLYNQCMLVWGKDEGKKLGKEKEAAKRKQDREALIRKLKSEEEAAKRKQVKDGRGKEREGRNVVKDVVGEGREEVKKKACKRGEMSQKDCNPMGGEHTVGEEEVEGEANANSMGGFLPHEEELEGEANANVNLTWHGNPMGGEQMALHVAESVPNRAGGREKGEEEKSAHGMQRQSNAAKNFVCKESNARENSSHGVLIGGRREPPSMQRGANDKPSGGSGGRSVVAAYQHNPRSVADIDQQIHVFKDKQIHVSNAARDVETNAARDVETNAARDVDANAAGDDERLSKESQRLMDMFKNEVYSQNRELINELKKDIMILKNDIMQMVKAKLRNNN